MIHIYVIGMKMKNENGWYHSCHENANGNDSSWSNCMNIIHIHEMIHIIHVIEIDWKWLFSMSWECKMKYVLEMINENDAMLCHWNENAL